MAEHSGCYSDIAALLNKAGFAVLAHDHRCHGLSVSRGALGNTSLTQHWAGICDDMILVNTEIHRRHPRYDGSAGPRDQTIYFTVRTSPAADGGLDLVVDGSLGTGKGHEGPGGGAVIELAAAARGWFVPFDMVRISQSRGGATGRLAETVELFSRRDGKEIPFMMMAEEGIVYLPAAP